MLKILGRERKTTTPTTADGSTPTESFHEYDVVVDDLSEAWEFINSSDDDEEDDLDNFSFTGEEEEEEKVDEDATTDEVVSSGYGPNNKQDGPSEFGSPSSDISMDTLSVQLLPNHDYGSDEINNDDCDDSDDYDDGHDLDDELVPWGLSDKFGRQRIRKLGKRAGPKMNKAKRLAYRYNRPGCVHGKHGFGVQHSYI